MGTNALPDLLKMLQTKEPFSISQWFQKLQFRFRLRHVYRYRAPPVSGFDSPAARIRHRAALGIMALGPEAKPTIAQLTLLFNSQDFTRESALILASMGAQGLPPLQVAISNNPSSWQSVTAMWALAHFPSNGQASIPFCFKRITKNII